ncbi:MAG: hypothetical protein JWN45_2235 [Acidobacteriaceae bacterium]|nr:hypothetical protein [Acidobacteriaceae bacterium]
MIPEVTHLSEAKRKLLEKYLRGDLERNGADDRGIAPRPYSGPAHLSLAQEQLWYRSRATASMPLLYNESITIHRNGPLDLSVLKRCILEILRRHESWRTSFENKNGNPVQVVHPTPNSISLPLFDIRGLPKHEREAEALRLAAHELQRPFHLSECPPVRFRLARLSDEEYWLFVFAHQIIIDGVTAYNVFFLELARLYEAFSIGQSTPLPEIPIQYSDYVDWQRRWFTEKVFAKQMVHWRNQLSGALPVLQWPMDFPRPATQTFNGRIYRFALSKNVAAAARRLSQRYNVTLFVTLMAAFIALLYRYTGQSDIIVGTVTPAGRDRSEVQCLMGYFLNPVGLRSDLSDDPTFATILSRTQDVILGALANDDVPFESVFRSLGIKPEPSRNPVFQVAASLEPAVPDVGPGWDLTPMDVQSGGARWDLYFVWEDRPVGITGRVQYNPDLFKLTTVTGLVEDFASVLETIAHNPWMKVSEISRLAIRNQLPINQ